jgi:hypothetical protein
VQPKVRMYMCRRSMRYGDREIDRLRDREKHYTELGNDESGCRDSVISHICN